MRRLIGLAAALWLGGCWWAGPIFYQPGDAADRPFRAGRYAVSQRDQDGKMEKSVVEFGYAADGSLIDRKQVNPTDHTLIAPIGANLFVVQISTGSDDASYGVARRLAGDDWSMDAVIDCAATMSIAAAAGAEIRDSSEPADRPSTAARRKPDAAAAPRLIRNPTCIFGSKRSLETALAIYAGSRPVFGMTLHRTGD